MYEHLFYSKLQICYNKKQVDNLWCGERETGVTPPARRRAARHAPKRTTAGQVTVALTGGNSGQSLTMRCDLS